MKAFLVLCLAALAVAKPKGLPKVGFRQDKIIGGHEAEPRECTYTNVRNKRRTPNIHSSKFQLDKLAN